MYRTNNVFIIGVLGAILPIAEYYSILIPLSLGTIIVIFLVPMQILRKRTFSITHIEWNIIALSMLIILSWIRNSISYGINNIGTIISTVASYLVFGCIYKKNDKSVHFMRRLVWLISCLITTLIICQYISHYILKSNLVLIPTQFLNASIYSRYFDVIESGLVSGKFFRPSAFFLEPSHLAMYSLTGIICVFFDPAIKKTKKYIFALYISLGIALSTSGLGILFMTILWVIYYIKYYQKDEMLKKQINVKHLFVFLIVSTFVFIALMQVNSFSVLVNEYVKAFSIEYTGNNYNPILGRTGTYDTLFNRGVFKFLFGEGFMRTPGYLTTLNALLYDVGSISVILFWVTLAKLFKRGTAFVKVMCIMIFLMSIVAEIHSPTKITFYLLLVRSEAKKTMQNSFNVLNGKEDGKIFYLN